MDKDYRDTYLDGFVKGLVAIQIRALREQFGLSQVEYAQKLGMTQSVVSRLEDTEYGGITVNTLLKIAKENNVALNIGFTDYMSVLQKDLRAEALKVDDIFESYEKYKTAYSVPAPVETYLTTNTFIFVYIGPQSPAVPRTEKDTTNLGVVSWAEPSPHASIRATQGSMVSRFRDPQYREVYSNVSMTSLSPFDITIVFQKMMEVAPGQPAIVDQVAVSFSPQQFKALVKSFTEP